jgi:hypothetical protein
MKQPQMGRPGLSLLREAADLGEPFRIALIDIDDAGN